MIVECRHHGHEHTLPTRTHDNSSRRQSLTRGSSGWGIPVSIHPGALEAGDRAAIVIILVVEMRSGWARWGVEFVQ